MLTASVAFLAGMLLLGLCTAGAGQTPTDRDIAAKYAPVFHQALGDHPRGDYITNFNFDGDWVGTNNWSHAEDKSFNLNAYVYFSVTETATHYFVTYAVFHARDYKGGGKGVLYSDLLRQGARILSKGQEPSGKLAEAAIAHENDMEGALVVVEKSCEKVVYLESLHHNAFGRYLPTFGSSPTQPTGLAFLSSPPPFRSTDGVFKTSDAQHVELYVEPKGHGIEAWGTEPEKAERGYLVYSYTGHADDPERSSNEKVGYDLLPIATSLWPKARTAAKNTAFAAFKDFGTITISVVSGDSAIAKKVVIGSLASAFDGKVGGVNVARPPWGWFSNDHRDDPPGLWFFDPARIVKRDFALGESFSTTYVKLPFWAAK